MKYLWTVLFNLAFIGVLLLIFRNLYDPDTEKIVAAHVIVYLTVITGTNSLTGQLRCGSMATLTMLRNL